MDGAPSSTQSARARPIAGSEDDALRVHAGSDEEAGDLRRLAEQEVGVGREALRRAQEVGEARLGKRRHAHARLRERALEVLEVGLELPEGEVVRDRGGRARPPVRLEGADDQPAAVVTHVDGPVEVAHDRQVAGRAFDRLRLGPVVLRRVQRQAGAGEQGEVARPEPCGDDGDLAGDEPAVGLDAGHAPFVEAEPGHADVLDDAGAEVERGLGGRVGGDPGIDGRVLLEQHAAHQVVDAEQRRDGGDLCPRDLVRRQAVVARHRERVAQLGHAFRRARHRERPVGVVPDVDAGERREPLVEVAAVARELCLRVRAAGARHEPGGVPAGAARDPAALEDDGVGPAQPGEVIGDGGADDAAADDDRPRSRGRSLGGPRIEVRRLSRSPRGAVPQRPSSRPPRPRGVCLGRRTTRDPPPQSRPGAPAGVLRQGAAQPQSAPR